jgi:hypothetical protein
LTTGFSFKFEGPPTPWIPLALDLTGLTTQIEGER